MNINEYTSLPEITKGVVEDVTESIADAYESELNSIESKDLTTTFKCITKSTAKYSDKSTREVTLKGNIASGTFTVICKVIDEEGNEQSPEKIKLIRFRFMDYMKKSSKKYGGPVNAIEINSNIIDKAILSLKIDISNDIIDFLFDN